MMVLIAIGIVLIVVITVVIALNSK